MITGNELVDWTDVDTAEQLFADILDPNTGEPVLVRVDDGASDAGISACGASSVQRSGNYIMQPAGSTTATVAANPLRALPRVRQPAGVSTDLGVGGRGSDAKKWWFIGDFRKAFAYMENWPITVTQAATGQRGGVQQRHCAAIQSQRARCCGGDQSTICREEHRLILIDALDCSPAGSSCRLSTLLIGTAGLLRVEIISLFHRRQLRR